MIDVIVFGIIVALALLSGILMYLKA
ncbi:hypothetical protein KIY76_gp64 [Mycobacterium phage Miramae]|uniref:Uncharacterized protein n=2 Tax=Viruses TaxID=10239 RepID=A0A482JCE1_9CAUD|nr:hypothetical protein KIY76_gp64 [Mycobacterium phage Miramae]QBP31477.1 hypothetical protein SEA_MIRAMAE_64 [Mycobacterium phage Miramae]QBP32472.1 hypothetical protein SEA_AVATARAHPEG_64 [Mycobacterium phage AvatarAhPeg]